MRRKTFKVFGFGAAYIRGLIICVYARLRVEIKQLLIYNLSSYGNNILKSSATCITGDVLFPQFNTGHNERKFLKYLSATVTGYHRVITSFPIMKQTNIFAP